MKISTLTPFIIPDDAPGQPRKGILTSGAKLTTRPAIAIPSLLGEAAEIGSTRPGRRWLPSVDRIDPEIVAGSA